MQFKNDYTARDAVLLAVQFYLEETLGQTFRIYALDENKVEISGVILMPIKQMLEELQIETGFILQDKSVELCDELVHINIQYLQPETRNNFYMDYDVHEYNFENVLSTVKQYVNMVIDGILEKVSDYEQRLSFITLIDNDADFATQIAKSIAIDYVAASQSYIANELFGKLYYIFCRECGKMHNSKRLCGSLALK